MGIVINRQDTGGGAAAPLTNAAPAVVAKLPLTG